MEWLALLCFFLSVAWAEEALEVEGLRLGMTKAEVVKLGYQETAEAGTFVLGNKDVEGVHRQCSLNADGVRQIFFIWGRSTSRSKG